MKSDMSLRERQKYERENYEKQEIRRDELMTIDKMEKKLGRKLDKDFKTFREKRNEDKSVDVKHQLIEDDHIRFELLYEMNKTVLSKQQMKGLTERLYTKLKRSGNTKDKIDLLGEMVMLLMREQLYGVK